jgi:hypothetical protein
MKMKNKEVKRSILRLSKAGKKPIDYLYQLYFTLSYPIHVIAGTHFIEFNCYGQVNMCLKWIKEGMKDPAKAMANKNIENIPPSLIKYFDWESKEAVDESLPND